jgi:hypothetical protein
MRMTRPSPPPPQQPSEAAAVRDGLNPGRVPARPRPPRRRATEALADQLGLLLFDALARFGKDEPRGHGQPRVSARTSERSHTHKARRLAHRIGGLAGESFSAASITAPEGSEST